MIATPPAKSIGYDRITRDFAAYLDGELIGYFPNYLAAETALNDLVLDHIAHGLVDLPLTSLDAPVAELPTAEPQNDVCWSCGDQLEMPTEMPAVCGTCAAAGIQWPRIERCNLRHLHGARVFVSKYDDLGEVFECYQSYKDRHWWYAIRLDSGTTVYGLTDADVMDRPDDTSEPMPPLLAADPPSGPPTIDTEGDDIGTLPVLDDAEIIRTSALWLLSRGIDACTVCGDAHRPTQCPEVAAALHAPELIEA